MVSTGIFPDSRLTTGQAAALAEACTDLPGAAARTNATRTAFVQAVLAGLGVG